MSDPTTIAQQFTQFYYQQFDSDRNGLASLYRDTSMLTWESSQIQGAAAITEKLVSLPFQKVQHKVVTIDAQPSSHQIASIIVLVTGQLLVDDGQNPLQFTQVFHLIPEGSSYFVFNDVFRLNYG
ncbi:nuclear transport factor 2 [Cryptococcus gattii Ru294]|uniref:Nuclear transport factor 2 n=2 Tax=Cryptococcus gattii TaxID=37769 RepID=E6RE88_CRYGW|nr:nuclear transport factor 2 (ntf-2), putative [Cryptococcus gattii WM276]KIR52298.1 nuclear transport factor 2 [Cryptococcus gattii Ru294]KIR76551.1 nuclear transport factor 2 [Cryptococcus gattii EJB2]KIY32108.1 nuclear transport factor 2 [Cryptococcus gattii E566]KJE02421.1 nuclear transport factor 2 [Cryptococcus gattii NT-10]ADV25308.1 nuclear transport factor 2 (ntf-2), putative [Cryptococcus gattii WM276]